MMIFDSSFVLDVGIAIINNLSKFLIRRSEDFSSSDRLLSALISQRKGECIKNSRILANPEREILLQVPVCSLKYSYL
jgi:hypothetical protein